MKQIYTWVILLIFSLFSINSLAKPWKGAEIITNETFKYGAFEARIRGAQGSGLITAFFLWKHDSELAHTEWQEQDFELFGSDGRYQTQIMTPGDPRTPHSIYHNLVNPSWKSFYTYRMEWTPDYLAFYVDGHLIRKETDPVEYAKLLDPNQSEPAQLRLSLWAGNSPWSGTFDPKAIPSEVLVDHVAVYSYSPSSGSDINNDNSDDINTSNFSLIWEDNFTTLNTNRWWFANWTFSQAVNDYTSQNANVIDGKLVLAFTDEEHSGDFPVTVQKDNPTLPTYDPSLFYENPSIDLITLPNRLGTHNIYSGYDFSPENEGDIECSRNQIDASLINSESEPLCVINYVETGEWIEYRIHSPVEAQYILTSHASSQSDTSEITVSIDDKIIASTVLIAGHEFNDYPITYTLTEGMHTLRIYFESGKTQLSHLDVTISDEITPVATPDVPGRIEAEAYTDYLDHSEGNEGQAICGSDDVDLQLTQDNSGVCNIGWTRPGEWVSYEINATEEGPYTLSLRTATGIPDVNIGVEIDGSSIASSISVPQTGWHTFENLDIPIHLSAGLHDIKIIFETGSANLNYLDFLSENIPPDNVDCHTQIIEAESMTPSTGGLSGDNWNIWTNGTLSALVDFTLFDPLSTSIIVYAKGSIAAGEWPHMNLIIDGANHDSLYIKSNSITPYYFSYSPEHAISNVVIEFDNDYYRNGEDRNLEIDKLEITDCQL